MLAKKEINCIRKKLVAERSTEDAFVISMIKRANKFRSSAYGDTIDREHLIIVRVGTSKGHAESLVYCTKTNKIIFVASGHCGDELVASVEQCGAFIKGINYTKGQQNG